MGWLIVASGTVRSRSPPVRESLLQGRGRRAAGVRRRIGIRQEEITYSELAIPGYADNTPDRCYVCKGELFRRLAVIAGERGLAAVLDGTNADDLGDFRPGRRAAEELAVRSPLSELGWGKAAIREALRELELPVWDKPSSPCLSSRVPYGDPITREKLEQIGRAEAALRELGFRELRVRHHGSTARIELPRAEMDACSPTASPRRSCAGARGRLRLRGPRPRGPALRLAGTGCCPPSAVPPTVVRRKPDSRGPVSRTAEADTGPILVETSTQNALG